MISNSELLELEKLLKEEQIFQARGNFYEYCKTLHPDFYKDNREYLKELCDTLQDFYFNDENYMIINIPPRHGKSFTATNFVSWILGQNPKEKIISGSYNEDLSRIFSKTVRDTINTEKIGENVVYNDIFPATEIQQGSAEAKKWKTSASNQINYLATSPNGTATGFGAGLEIFDDLIKNAEDANNEMVLDGIWNWFNNTMLSRLEGKKKILIIMTRWNDKDLAGRLLTYLKEKGRPFSHVNFKAFDGSKMLCEDLLNREEMEAIQDTMAEEIFSANYQQEPVNKKGRLYEYFQTYNELPKNIKAVENYTDTADTGSDFLASITYAIGEDNNAYILDIIYTKEPMETTEKLVAKALQEYRVNWCRIEANNGGRGFSRNVERITNEAGNRTTIFRPFTQSKNKQSRIYTNSTGVMKNIYFPKGWETTFRQAYQDLFAYQRDAKNKHDDIQDAITGVNETLESRYKKGGNLSGLRL